MINTNLLNRGFKFHIAAVNIPKGSGSFTKQDYEGIIKKAFSELFPDDFAISEVVIETSVNSSHNQYDILEAICYYKLMKSWGCCLVGV